MTAVAHVAPRALYEEVAERLRQRIYSRELAPGDWVDELKIAEQLGISRTPLRAAQRTTLGVIATVLGVTLVAVLFAAYVLFRRLLGPLALIGDAMLRVARGDLRYRIRLVRQDELGRLFAAFNLMAGALQSRQRRPLAPRTQRGPGAVAALERGHRTPTTRTRPSASD